MGLVLGLDSGGTKTVAVVADQSGRVVAHRSGPGLDPTAAPDWEARLKALTAPFGPVDAACLGLPFHGEMPEVSARQIAVAQALLGPAAQIRNDVDVAFHGAFAGAEGVLILAGTGSMAWARGPLGTVRTGGWGDAFGDEGSAYWIGREALAILGRHLDGRQAAGPFAGALLGHMGIAAADLIGWAYGSGSSRADLAGVARHVSALASAGDPVARALMGRAAGELAALGLAAARISGQQPLRWSHAGGVFADPGLGAAVAMLMGKPPQPPVLPPVGGAVLLAARQAGWPCGAEFITALATALGDGTRAT